MSTKNKAILIKFKKQKTTLCLIWMILNKEGWFQILISYFLIVNYQQLGMILIIKYFLIVNYQQLGMILVINVEIISNVHQIIHLGGMTIQVSRYLPLKIEMIPGQTLLVNQ